MLRGLFSSKKKLFFKVTHLCAPEDTPHLPLYKAVAGSVGTVLLGKHGAELWTPATHSSHIKPQQEIVCDLRYEPFSEKLFEGFCKAAKNRFLPARFALLRAYKTPANQKRDVREVLQHFNYVLLPNENIHNLPVDFRNRVLGYTAQEEADD